MSAETLYSGTVSLDKPYPEAWDRRRHSTGTHEGIRTLERAARHLILGQMTRDRVYSPGAKDAVLLLWTALEAIHAETHTQQRVSRFAAAWLPQHAILRWQRDQALADHSL